MGHVVKKLTPAFVALLLVCSVSVIAAVPGGAAPSVRGFDGTTITVAGLGPKSSLPNVERGARARIKRFNDTNEVKGVKIDFSEYADDKNDPATSLSEARRLVSQVGVFALVGESSIVTPGDYLTQQQVPFFGGGFNDKYCSNKPSTALWGFAVLGCVVPNTPSFISDFYFDFYDYVSKKTGTKHPTFVTLNQDTATGHNGAKNFSKAAKGAGFDVVAIQDNIPLPPVSDYTPYVQAALRAKDGSQPDAIYCSLAPQCVPFYQLLQSSGFKGVFGSGLYTDLLVKQMAGSVVSTENAILSDSTPGVPQMRKDIDALSPGAGAKLDSGDLYGYGSADMFIQALKAVAKDGKGNITPQNIRKYASTMTWQIKGLIGPVQYPKSTVMTYPACFSMFSSDGTQWTTVVPLSCSKKTYKP